jgi:Fe-S oxidoreductase
MMLDGSIQKKGNPYSSDADLRTMWTEYMDSSEVPVKEKAQTVYFVGCTSALKAQVQDIPSAIALILNRAGEDWTFLGDKEWCCGSPSLMIGNREKAKELAEHNTELIESKGAKRVVTGCPGCYRALKKYPELVGRTPEFEVFHIVELINQYLKDGRLSITEKFKEKIAYHDPCELGQLSGITEEPRAILRAITDEFVEIPENKSDSRCCGGGGLLQATDGELRLQIAQHRITQAKETDAKILVSACPSCKMALLDAIQSINTEMKMIDLTELVAQKLSASPQAKP